MRGTRATRLLTTLVTLLFFAGEAGTSGLDALLFHGRGTAADPVVTHVERGNGAGHHADQCLLALRLASGSVSPTLGVAIRFEGIPSRDVAVCLPSEPHRYYTGLHQQSRAPPA